MADECRHRNSTTPGACHHSFSGHAYDDLGAARFADVDRDYAIRIQRWQVSFDPRLLLRLAWVGHARDEACARGLSQAHILYSPTEHVIAEVTIGPSRERELY